MKPQAFREQDLIECLNVYPGNIGEELIGRASAMKAWKQLVRHAGFHAVMIEADRPIAGHRIVGFGASIFVSSAFVQDEISRPRPGMNARIIASVDSGAPVILSRADLEAGNAQGGLNLAVLYGDWLRGVLDRDAVFDAQMILTSSFLEDHAGYGIKLVIRELADEVLKCFFERSDPWRIFRTFGEFYSQQPPTTWNSDRALAVLTRENVRNGLLPVRAAAMLFEHRKPVLRLHDGHKEQQPAENRRLNLDV